jgi:ATP-dependent DNA helicase HFM1/MER3
MKEYFIFKRNYKGAINSTLLAKSLYQKLWDDSPYLLKQLPGIGMVTAKVIYFTAIWRLVSSSFGEIDKKKKKKLPISNSLVR